MSGRYLEILAIQRPFPIGNDALLRSMFSLNFRAKAASPIDNWEEDIVTLLQNVVVGITIELGNNAWIGRDVEVPAGDGPFINFIDTGGRAPDFTQNNTGIENLSMQIVVRGNDFVLARTWALTIYETLNNQRNVTIVEME